jgi:hypothetical protein
MIPSEVNPLGWRVWGPKRTSGGRVAEILPPCCEKDKKWAKRKSKAMWSVKLRNSVDPPNLLLLGPYTEVEALEIAKQFVEEGKIPPVVWEWRDGILQQKR